MAPKLDDKTREEIAIMINMHNLSNREIARIAKVNARTVTRHRRNMCTHGINVITDYTRHNPKLKVNQEHKEDALQYMNDHPAAQQKEVAAYLNQKYGINVTGSTVCRLLKSMGWKTSRAKLKEKREVEKAEAAAALAQQNEYLRRMEAEGRLVRVPGAAVVVGVDMGLHHMSSRAVAGVQGRGHSSHAARPASHADPADPVPGGKNVGAAGLARRATRNLHGTHGKVGDAVVIATGEDAVDKRLCRGQEAMP